MNQVIVDDASPELHYFGNWTLGGDPSDEYMGTVHYTSTSGDRTTFSFTGTWVGVYGTIGVSGVNLTFELATNTGYGASVATNRFNVTQADHPVYRQAYYDSGVLPYGQHNLTMTNENGSVVYMDYIEYNTSSAAGSSIAGAAGAAAIASRIGPMDSIKAGIAVAIVLPLCLIAGLTYFFLRKIHAMQRQNPVMSPQSDYCSSSCGSPSVEKEAENRAPLFMRSLFRSSNPRAALGVASFVDLAESGRCIGREEADDASSPSEGQPQDGGQRTVMARLFRFLKPNAKPAVTPFVHSPPLFYQPQAIGDVKTPLPLHPLRPDEVHISPPVRNLLRGYVPDILPTTPTSEIMVLEHNTTASEFGTSPTASTPRWDTRILSTYERVAKPKHGGRKMKE